MFIKVKGVRNISSSFPSSSLPRHPLSSTLPPYPSPPLSLSLASSLFLFSFFTDLLLSQCLFLLRVILFCYFQALFSRVFYCFPFLFVFLLPMSFSPCLFSFLVPMFLFFILYFSPSRPMLFFYLQAFSSSFLLFPIPSS